MLGVLAIWRESDAGALTGAEEYAMLGVNAVALGIQSTAVLRLGISGLSTTYLTGTLTLLVASLTNCQAPILGRHVVIALALIVGAGWGAVVALDVPRLAPAVPIVVLTFVDVCGEIVFRHRTRQRALASLARKAA